MKVLMAGDIVGSPGRSAFARSVTLLKKAGKADFVVANAENAAGGKGLTTELADELLDAGADVLTLGDHTWDQKNIEKALRNEPRLVRPANFAPECPGRGWTTVESRWGEVTVINLVGRTFMKPSDCPFRVVDSILKHLPKGSIMLVDFHAEATSEKIAMGLHLDGRVTAVVGTHTHVQTSDERVLPGGTAYITDLGMTGPGDSIIGCDPENVLAMFISGMKARFQVARHGKSASLEGVVLDIDESTGKAGKIKRVRK